MQQLGLKCSNVLLQRGSIAQSNPHCLMDATASASSALVQLLLSEWKVASQRLPPVHGGGSGVSLLSVSSYHCRPPCLHLVRVLSVDPLLLTCELLLCRCVLAFENADLLLQCRQRISTTVSAGTAMVHKLSAAVRHSMQRARYDPHSR